MEIFYQRKLLLCLLYVVKVFHKHYDWGLRALKIIITVALQQIQNYLNQGKIASYEEEKTSI